MQVVFRSTFFAPSGYGNSAREIVFALEDAGVNVKIESMGDRYPFLRPDVLHRLQQLENRRLEPERLLLTVSAGPTPEDQTQYRKMITCVMWETTRAPAAMSQGCNQMDAMIVPNALNTEAFRNAGVSIPIFVAPYGVNSSVFTPAGAIDRLGEPQDNFLFLSIFGWSARKGPDALIKAFVQEFRADEPVVLIVKTHGLTANQFPQGLFDQVMADLNPAHRPRIRLLTEALSTERIAELLRGSDCFVLPTRGEGIGLPILESMSCGTPAIATGWGGQTDFLHPDNGYLIPFALVPAHPLWWTDLYQPNQLWAEPDVGALQSLMRRAYGNREELRERGIRARATAVQKTWAQTASAFIAAMEAVVGQPLR